MDYSEFNGVIHLVDWGAGSVFSAFDLGETGSERKGKS